MAIKYIFADIDGTLGIGGIGIPEKNRQAIRNFVEEGGKFGVCTGRSPGSVKGFIGDIPINTLSVINGGCALYDFQKDKYLDELCVEENALQFAFSMKKELEQFTECRIVIVNRTGYWQVQMEGMQADEAAAAQSGGAQVDVSSGVQPGSAQMDAPSNGQLGGMQTGTPAAAQPACPRRRGYLIAPLEQIEKPWYRIILRVSPQDGTKCAALVRQQKQDGVRIEHTEDALVEIMNEASGKGDALRRACRYLGCSAEEVAFIGDFYNDMEALKAAGISACVKNAPQEVKDCCDMVLSDCMDGAVAEFIERVRKDG